MTENDSLNSIVSIVLSGHRMDGQKITCVAKFCSGRIECDGGGLFITVADGQREYFTVIDFVR